MEFGGTGKWNSKVSLFYLLQSSQQVWGDGGHVVRVESHTSTAHFLCKHSLRFQLRHKFTDCFLMKHIHTISVKTQYPAPGKIKLILGKAASGRPAIIACTTLQVNIPV